MQQTKNKKVINATTTECDGIFFKSKLELACYNILKEAGFNPKYESKTFTLAEGFKLESIKYYTAKNKEIVNDSSKIRAITYTPDFIFRVGNKMYIVEAKGHPNDVYPYKRKLFLKGVNDLFKDSDDKVYFIEVFNQRQMKSVVEKIKNDEL